MNARRAYQVKDLARIAGVSVRALHHYDEIGLLVPSGRTPAGYRLYDERDLLRLQQVLVGRALGLPLEEIRRSLDDPEFDHRQALLAQRRQLQERVRECEAMLRALDTALAALDESGEEIVRPESLFEGFDPAAYEDEARRRWGETKSYRAARARTKRYGPDDWKRIRGEQDGLYAEAAAARAAGRAPDDAESVDIAERLRLSIDRWFYPCTRAMHAHLADLYESDGRFAETIDRHGEKLTTFLVAAIRANSRRAGG